MPTVYIGWELIGLTSALLISFFAFRKQTVSNSLRAFWAYRVTDSGILVATLLAMHHGIEGFAQQVNEHPHMAIVLGCLLSAVGKSAQFPFGRWLPKAMEGPTPSSAIFYGGLSVHAGMYLMLRASQVYGLPTPVVVAMVVIGVFSVWYATLVGRIQSDAKSMLAYASMAQVGVYCGVLFNFIYSVVFIAFGERVFSTRSAGSWLAIQLLVSLGLLCENVELFALVVAAALVLHIKVSQEDVYQVSRRQDRFIVVVFSSLLAVVLAAGFFGCVAGIHGLTSFRDLVASAEGLPRYLKVLSSLLMMNLLGAFPFHFWVKPLFGSPGRYGLAVITRLNSVLRCYPCSERLLVISNLWRIVLR